jgi:hypothetical protein
VADADVPEEVWREEGYGKAAVKQEMKRRGEQITALAVERLKQIGIPAEVVVTRGDPRHLVPFFARKWSSDLIFVRAHVRKDMAHWMLGSVARAAWGQATTAGERLRGGRDERALLGGGRARPRANFEESSEIRLKLNRHARKQ